MDKDTTVTVQSIRDNEAFMVSGFGRSLNHTQHWPPSTINVKRMKGMNEPIESNTKSDEKV